MLYRSRSGHWRLALALQKQQCVMVVPERLRPKRATGADDVDAFEVGGRCLGNVGTMMEMPCPAAAGARVPGKRR